MWNTIFEAGVTALGVVVIGVAANDIFHTLFQPQGQGRLSGWMIRGVWSISKRVPLGGRFSSLSGPIAMVAVIGSWALLVILGWALVYWPHMSESFAFSTGLDPEQRSDLVDAVYLSLVAVTTLGIGDIMPTAAWLRIAMPVQAMMGFGILTAAVSWVLQVYPAITRSRSLSRWLSGLSRQGKADDLLAVDGSLASQLLTGLARDIIDVHVDLEQYSETYYYRSGDRASSLPATIWFARDLVQAAARAERADVRLAGDVLGHALDDLAGVLTRFLPGDRSTEQMLDAYAGDHGVQPRP